MTHQCPHCHALLCHGDEELQCSSFRLTPNLKKPPPKKNPKHTSKQKTTHSQQTRKHTLFPATTKVLFLTLILLPLSYSQGFVTTHSPNTPKLLFQQKPRQIFRHTRLPTKPQKKLTSAYTVIIYNFQNHIIFPIYLTPETKPTQSVCHSKP